MKQLLGLKRKIVIKLLPGLPAYIFFMCTRYTDNIEKRKLCSKY
uniref:Unconventional myosin-va isoform x1 n=1 Tax=Triatoma infestans TaxID=30076 RepID=A0A161M0M9_TRIIF